MTPQKALCAAVIVVVAAASFCGGVYYVLSGGAVPPAVASWANPDPQEIYSGSIVVFNESSLVLQTGDGKTMEFTLTPQTRLLAQIEPFEIAAGEVQAGALASVVSAQGQALSIQLAISPDEFSSTTRPIDNR